MAEPATVQQEIKNLGIQENYFNKFYEQLKEKKQLPLGDIVPWDQYKKITDYLRESKVLGEDNKVSEKTFKVFDTKKTLERILPTGGLAPCRHVPYTSNGGMVPCRESHSRGLVG